MSQQTKTVDAKNASQDSIIPDIEMPQKGSQILQWRGPHFIKKSTPRLVEADLVLSKLKQACEAIYSDDLKFSTQYRNYVKNVFHFISQTIIADTELAFNIEKLEMAKNSSGSKTGQ